MVVVVAIIRVNGPTSDQQGLELNTVMLGFLYQDQGEEDDDGKDEEDDDGDDDGECFGEGQGLCAGAVSCHFNLRRLYSS